MIDFWKRDPVLEEVLEEEQKEWVCNTDRIGLRL